jgi:hypothetical protein
VYLALPSSVIIIIENRQLNPLFAISLSISWYFCLGQWVESLIYQAFSLLVTPSGGWFWIMQRFTMAVGLPNWLNAQGVTCSIYPPTRRTSIGLRSVGHGWKAESASCYPNPLVYERLWNPFSSRQRPNEHECSYTPLLSLSEIRSNKKAKLSIRKKRLKLIHGMN